MPRTARLQLTEEALTQIHIALDARIEALEPVDDPDEAPNPDLMVMLRLLDQDITEARRAV
jgi:hypothetical protein